MVYNGRVYSTTLVKKIEIILRLLRVPLDFLAVLGGFLLAYFLRSEPRVIEALGLTNPVLMPFLDFLWFSLQAAILIIIVLAWERMYSLRKSPRFSKEIRRVIVLTGAAFTVIIVYFFATGVLFFSRFIFGLAAFFALFGMFANRLLLRWILKALWRRGLGRRRILMLGEGTMLTDVLRLLQRNPGFLLVGRLTAERRSVPIGELKILGSYDDLEKVLKGEDIDEVLQISALPREADMVEFCQLNHIEYRFVPNMLEVQRTNTEIEFVDNIPIITLRSSAIDGWARVVKRAVDIVASLFGLILLSPLFVLVALFIKLEDRGPVFYRSRRVSKDRQFWMWKFRSMIVDADKRKAELIEANRREGPLFKIAQDPRITRVGRLLRKTSMDELPQLWNVLKGDLSLVGPRPHLPEEVAQYEKHHRKVLAIKAGVTGLAQVSGRSKLDFENEVKLDVYYLENWSIWLDLKIVLKTFGVVLEGE